ncbi:MAG: hypothetical protein R2883_06750 [Caldisericia bacterium]
MNTIHQKSLLSLKQRIYKVYYPKGWESTTGVNGSCTISFMTDKITIPFVIAVDENVKTNDLESISEFTDILRSSNPNGKTEIKKISGKKSMWWYFDIMGVELASFILPLDGVIVTGMIWTRQSEEINTENLKLARMVVDSFRLIDQ